MPDNRQEGVQGKETLEEPRLPYGTAIKAGYFRHDSPVAESFVGWFRRVFKGD